MIDIQPKLSQFHSVDAAALQIERAGTDLRPSQVLRISAGELALGPLAEALILKWALRTRGKTLVVAGRSSRENLLRSALGAAGCKFTAAGSVGVLRAAAAGRVAEMEEVNRFVLALGQAVRAQGMPDGAVGPLCAAAGELVDNIGEHAGSAVDAFAAYEFSRGECWLTVADAGRGILAGYREAGLTGSDTPADAAEALDWAVLQHRSRTMDPARGLGFKRLQAVLRSMDATVRIRSDDASLEIEGAGSSADWLSREQVELRGFVVSAVLAWKT